MSVKHRMRVEKSEKNLFGNQGGNAVYSVPNHGDGVFYFARREEFACKFLFENQQPCTKNLQGE